MGENMRFSPAQIGRAGEDVALQLEAAILEEKISPGERLPSERELQAQFQTGRGVIREAIKVLRQKGLIDVHKGARGGAYVKKIDVGQISESLALFLKQSHVDNAHITDFRESIDLTITTLAIARATSEEKWLFCQEVEQLKTFLDCAEPDLEALAETDRQLNIHFSRMARNPIFEWVMSALQFGFSSKDFALYRDPEFRCKTILNWCETARNIAQNEPLRAAASIGRHYAVLRDCIMQNNTNNGSEEARKSSSC